MKQNSRIQPNKKMGDGPKFTESISKIMEVTCLENTLFPHVRLEKRFRVCKKALNRRDCGQHVQG